MRLPPLAPLAERVRRHTEGRIFRSAVQESLGWFGFGMVTPARGKRGPRTLRWAAS